MPGSNSNNTKPRMRSRKVGRRGPVGPRNIPASATAYNGSLRMPVSDTGIAILRDNATVTTAPGGTIAGTFNNNPSNSRNWTEYSTSWVEYRTLGVKFTYFPIANAPSSVLLGFAGYHGISHGTITAPTTLAEAASTGDSRGWNAFRNFVREWRMSTPGEALWQPTSGPASTSDALVLFATGGGVSLYYGDVLIEYLVQFKTHAK